jgi:hypothetical protein
MRTVFYMTLITLVVAAYDSSAAKLQIGEHAQHHIEQVMSKKVNGSANFSNLAITGKEEIEGTLIVFEVIKAKKSDSLQQCFSRRVSLSGNVVFNPAKGAYCYNNIGLQKQPLKATGVQDLCSLKIKASSVLEQLLGKDQADRFVSANEETDYVKERDISGEKILRKTYRFTRKINGRHILDNTSFVRLSFSADQELSGFEIVNPEITPLRNVERLVKTAAIESRLTEYAASKQTAVKNGVEGTEEVGVTLIRAEKGFDTYLSKKAGDKTLLLPTVSFYSDYQLENGDHFENWSHFCLDADYVPNIDKDLIEGCNR